MTGTKAAPTKTAPETKATTTDAKTKPATKLKAPAKWSDEQVAELIATVEGAAGTKAEAFEQIATKFDRTPITVQQKYYATIRQQAGEVDSDTSSTVPSITRNDLLRYGRARGVSNLRAMIRRADEAIEIREAERRAEATRAPIPPVRPAARQRDRSRDARRRHREARRRLTELSRSSILRYL